jgi:hypothetical protein
MCSALWFPAGSVREPFFPGFWADREELTTANKEVQLCKEQVKKLYKREYYLQGIEQTAGLNASILRAKVRI